MSLQVSSLCPLIQVFDMLASIRFYCDALGFEIVSASEEKVAPEGSYFDWAWLRLGGADLMLNTVYESDKRPPDRDRSRHDVHGDTGLYFDCPDVDGAYRHLRASGVAVEAPVTEPNGMKQLYLRDPNGYQLCF